MLTAVHWIALVSSRSSNLVQCAFLWFEVTVIHDCPVIANMNSCWGLTKSALKIHFSALKCQYAITVLKTWLCRDIRTFNLDHCLAPHAYCKFVLCHSTLIVLRPFKVILIKLTSAPALSNALTASVWPPSAANIKADFPFHCDFRISYNSMTLYMIIM